MRGCKAPCAHSATMPFSQKLLLLKRGSGSPSSIENSLGCSSPASFKEPLKSLPPFPKRMSCPLCPAVFWEVLTLLCALLPRPRPSSFIWNTRGRRSRRFSLSRKFRSIKRSFVLKRRFFSSAPLPACSLATPTIVFYPRLPALIYDLLSG